MIIGGSSIADKSPQTVKAASVLNECCEQSSACRLHLLHSGHVIDATFQHGTVGRIVLHVTGGLRHDALQPEALCCVAFAHLQSVYAFVACAKRVRDGELALEVHFDPPATLTATNLRHSYRVPVARESKLDLELVLSNGNRISGNVLNISESGIEVELSGDDIRLAVDTEVRCDLRFRDDRLELPAIVRRRQPCHRAFQFMLVRTLELRSTILTLQRIVRTLEQIWLKSRRN